MKDIPIWLRYLVSPTSRVGLHARRYIYKVLKNDQQRVSIVLKLIQLLYAIEALARESNMDHQQWYELRLEKSLPIVNQIGFFIYYERDKVLPKSPIGVAEAHNSNIEQMFLQSPPPAITPNRYYVLFFFFFLVCYLFICVNIRYFV